jgi:diguanylate cyclase (GGDEF)-like protein
MMIRRYFDPLTISNLRSKTRLPIVFESTMDMAVPDEASGSPGGLIINSPTWIKRNSESTHTIYAALHDFKSKPAAILGFEAPRDIYLQGRQTMFLWVVFTLTITAVLTITGLYLLNTLIFKRLSFFVKTVADIRLKNDLSSRLPVKGQDEISKLEREFNRLLSSVEQSRSQSVKLAYEDSLTRLPNRAYFFKEAGSILKAHKAVGASAAIMFMDLDGFKQVNDRYGHEAGDMLLKHVANVLRGTLRTADIVSRLGGDEFILFISNVRTHEEVSHVAQRICESISTPIDLDGQIAHVSSSIGISFYPEHETDLNSLISNADEAMFIAKNREKNQYAFYKELVAAE